MKAKIEASLEQVLEFLFHMHCHQSQPSAVKTIWKCLGHSSNHWVKILYLQYVPLSKQVVSPHPPIVFLSLLIIMESANLNNLIVLLLSTKISSWVTIS